MKHQIDPEKTNPTASLPSPFAEHSRRWESFSYVYPVVSRRSRGLSIGINLNPDTICNFDCVYCQVDKQESPKPVEVDLRQLRSELSAMLQSLTSGELWRHPRFADVDPELKHLNDIAFSGDGEPTACKVFTQAVDLVVELKDSHGLSDAKLILITNATLLNRPAVETAIQTLDENNGEVWAKLDAGTEAYYKRVDRSAVAFKTILENILACGKRRPIVIQSMFANLHDEPVPADEFDAYTDRLAELVDRGCRIKAVQLYTVARQPLEPYVTATNDETLSQMADRLSREVPGLEVQWFGASG
jgi:wyosine [tRNA(Phe)-imidazoG37] synthetase (radical SAM superfamily)